MDINKKMSQFVDIEGLDETTLIPIVQGSPLFSAKITPKKFAQSIAPYVLLGIDFSAVELRLDTNELAIQNLESNKVDNSRVLTDVPLNAKFTDTLVDISGKADITYVDERVKTPVPINAVFTDTIVDTSGKVDKEPGKSLILDTEIARLASISGGDNPLAGEPTQNKQNSLAVDGSGVKFPTVDAVNLALESKVDNSRVKTDVPLGAKFTDTIVDISNKADKSELPTKVSQLTNDSNFITAADIPGGGDMSKSVYDTDNSGVVDNAERVNGLTVETAVPLNAIFTDTITDVSGLATKLELEDKVDKEFGMTLIDEEEVTRLSTVVNQDISNLVVKEAGKSLVDDAEILRLSTVTNQDLSDLATKAELETKVDKIVGKSLIDDAEITRLESVVNQVMPTELPANGGNADTVGGYTIVVTTEAEKGTDANTLYFCIEA